VAVGLIALLDQVRVAGFSVDAWISRRRVWCDEVPHPGRECSLGCVLFVGGHLAKVDVAVEAAGIKWLRWRCAA
jgi:hypothetical protein